MSDKRKRKRRPDEPPVEPGQEEVRFHEEAPTDTNPAFETTDELSEFEETRTECDDLAAPPATATESPALEIVGVQPVEPEPEDPAPFSEPDADTDSTDGFVDLATPPSPGIVRDPEPDARAPTQTDVVGAFGEPDADTDPTDGFVDLATPPSPGIVRDPEPDARPPDAPFSEPDADTDSTDGFVDLATPPSPGVLRDPGPDPRSPTRTDVMGALRSEGTATDLEGDAGATRSPTQTDVMGALGGEGTATDLDAGPPSDLDRGTQTDIMDLLAADTATRVGALQDAAPADETADAAAPAPGDETVDQPLADAGPDATQTDIMDLLGADTKTELGALPDAPARAEPPVPVEADPKDETAEIDPPPADASAPLTIVPTAAPLFALPPDVGRDEPDPEPRPDEAAPDAEEAPAQAPLRARLLKRLRTLRAAVTAWKGRSRPAKPDLKLDRSGPWWRRTLTEIGLLYLIVVPIEMAVNSGAVGAFGVHPHPYWLIILPMAGARGVVAGLLAAAIGSILYCIGAAAGIGSVLGIFTYDAMREPILFFAVAFFAGELRDELATRYRKLERQLKDVQERARRLRQERDVLGDANRELEKRIVDHSVQFDNMIVAAARIERAGRREVFEIALDLVEEHCGAAASVLLVLDDGTLDYLCHRGWLDDELPQRMAAARASEFVNRALAEGRAVNGFAAEETPPVDGPLVVAPLFDQGGLVKALLCLDAIPASHLNEASITIFLGIAEWVSASLARVATEAEPVRAPPALPPMAEAGAWLGQPEDLGDRLRLELERCARYGVPASFLAIQAVEWTDTTLAGASLIDRFIMTRFTGGLRPSDELFRFGYPGCYLLVLAGTSVQGAEVVRTRLLRRVEYGPSSDVGRIEIFATGPDAEAPDLRSLVDRVAGRFRSHTRLPLDSKCPVAIPEQAHEGSVDAFIRRLRMETSLAIRNSFSLHVLGISAESTDGSILSDLARHIREAGARTLRPTDGVYMIGPHDCAVICPCTDSEEAATAAHRLVGAVRRRDPDGRYGGIETKVLSLGTAHPDAESFLRALARSRRQET